MCRFRWALVALVFASPICRGRSLPEAKSGGGLKYMSRRPYHCLGNTRGTQFGEGRSPAKKPPIGRAIRT